MNTYKNKIETLISTWNAISSVNEWEKWATLVRAQKFGTYGTISIFDVIDNTEVKFPTSWVKDSFLKEVKDALNNVKY
jgi:hypothetical protein